MSSAFFPGRSPVRYAPRVEGPKTKPNIQCTAALWATIKREAADCGVTASNYWQEACLGMIANTHAERTMGLLPLPVRVSEDDLASLADAAQRSGLSLTTLVGHAVLIASRDADLIAASLAAPAENNNDTRAAAA